MNVTSIANHGCSINPVQTLLSPFVNMTDEAFNAWAKLKLRYAKDVAKGVGIVAIAKPEALSEFELMALHDSIRTVGFALYQLTKTHKNFSAQDLITLSAQLGLQHLDKNRCAYQDGISRIQNDTRDEQKHYIPYSNRALNWHTDGYYNQPEQRVAAFTLHCVRPSSEGGGNLFLDHEMVYLLMRQHDPKLVKALFREDAMAIPLNSIDKTNLREEYRGPVFWQDPNSGRLQMRYTARTRSIRWSDDAAVQEAVAFIRELLKDSIHIKRHKLKAGEGVISNNCLHARDAFDDSATDAGKGRLLLRARFFSSTRCHSPRQPH